MALTRALRQEFGPGYSIEGALSAEEAFAIIDGLEGRDVELKVVVSDLLMPGLRGDDFLRAVARTRPAVKCILLTGMPGSEEEDRLRRDIGLVASLPKPCNNSQLAQAVRDALAAPSLRAR